MSSSLIELGNGILLLHKYWQFFYKKNFCPRWGLNEFNASLSANEFAHAMQPTTAYPTTASQVADAVPPSQPSVHEVEHLASQAKDEERCQASSVP